MPAPPQALQRIWFVGFAGHRAVPDRAADPACRITWRPHVAACGFSARKRALVRAFTGLRHIAFDPKPQSIGQHTDLLLWGTGYGVDLRWIDVASEIAFTYVDLLAHGRKRDTARCA